MMAKLTGRQRRKLPKSKFALPGRRAYPIDTKARARNALARASQNESKATQKTIRSRVTKMWPSLKKNKRKS
ncbi:hypothetical protein AB0B07_33600 [Streptomyces sioyaensis]|uniref:hypothetical protein n=1 Tax=Streptomyces sioyaensis TaxID=67364 RepID=UPI0033DAF43C